MKDNNFDEIEHKISLSKESCDKLRKMCKNDSEFLRDMELMDYSLFLIKISLPKKEMVDIFGSDIINNQTKASDNILIDDNEEDKNDDAVKDNNDNMKRNFSVMGEGKLHDIEYYKPYLYPSINQGTAYILSIIDYLQLFNFFKYLEMELKTKFRKDGKKVISCVDPKAYSDRFINYIIDVTDLENIFKPEHQLIDNNEETKPVDVSNFNTGELSVSNININNDNFMPSEVGDLTSKNDLLENKI